MYMTFTVLLSFIVFLLGLYYYTKTSLPEGFQSQQSKSQCPNLLIQKDINKFNVIITTRLIFMSYITSYYELTKESGILYFNNKSNKWINKRL